MIPKTMHYFTTYRMKQESYSLLMQLSGKVSFCRKFLVRLILESRCVQHVPQEAAEGEVNINDIPHIRRVCMDGAMHLITQKRHAF